MNPQETIMALTHALSDANMQISDVSFAPEVTSQKEPLTNQNNPAMMHTQQI
jgi:hypothetical protein